MYKKTESSNKNVNGTGNGNIDFPSIPDTLNLPTPPSHTDNGSDSFDDLAARFENLKKK